MAEVKYRLLDTTLALIGGALVTTKDELESLCAVIREEEGIRPVWPLRMLTSIEMAGFLNAYFIRGFDWGDTYRRKGIIIGHLSDQIAVILAPCSTPGVSGCRVIEMIHIAYHIYIVLQEHMLCSRPDLDYTTALSLTTPLIAAIYFGDPL